MTSARQRDVASMLSSERLFRRKLKMSEPKKQSEILQEQIDALKKELATLKTPPSTSTSEHKHSANVEFECPDCQKAYDAEVVAKARPNIIQEMKEKFKKKDLVICDGCGELVEKEADECPTCHGTRAH
jgi:hypothetical protein